ncbi:MAG TPA: tRNA lysidine(34) synthetase TilS, partial [Limnochordia bacterium]|nr:tRNA lysidine(34) synthetase TilS [Limnochordia bacterium]
RTADCEDFDLAELKPPLVVRTRREGDRLRPFGGKGTKKVKDLLIDARIPVQVRDVLPLVCDEEGILWIPGVRRSDRAALSDATQMVLRLTNVSHS